MFKQLYIFATIVMAAHSSPCSSYQTCADCLGKGSFCGWFVVNSVFELSFCRYPTKKTKTGVRLLKPFLQMEPKDRVVKINTKPTGIVITCIQPERVNEDILVMLRQVSANKPTLDLEIL